MSLPYEPAEQPKLRKIGLIMGMSPMSSTLYYSSINRAINEHFNNQISAPMVMENVNPAEFLFERLRKNPQFKAEIVLPEYSESLAVAKIIFSELFKDPIDPFSVYKISGIINTMRRRQHIDSVILSNTELGIAISENARIAINLTADDLTPIQFFDAGELHIKAIVKFCCDGILPQI